MRSEKQLATEFIQWVEKLREAMQLPLRPEKFTVADVESVVTDAIKETGESYPVPRYLDRSEVYGIVRGLM